MSRPLVRVGAALDGESAMQDRAADQSDPAVRHGLYLAANVADDAAKSRAQEFELPPSALELVGMRIAPHHNGRALATRR